MDKSDICIVIPIYKDSLTYCEILSVFQCIKVLGEYSIFFICAEDLDLAFYKENFSQIDRFSFFETKYFESVEGYNQLMLNPSFYKTFGGYKYMLVYQTDCYVFRDELLVWAQKKYDYIGGLWFDDFVKNPEHGAQLCYPGNGGFSLRKIETMIQILISKKSLMNWKQIINQKRNINNGRLFKDVKGALVLVFNFFGYENNSSFYAKKWKENEDVFFLNMHLMYNKLKVPAVTETILFSWDRRPDYLFKKYNHLPFACHAWYRTDFPYTENKDFWSNFIELK